MNYSHGDSAEALLSETHSRVVERRGQSKVDNRLPAKKALAGVRCTWQLRWQHVDGVHGCICLCMCVQVHMHVWSMVVVIYVFLGCSPFYLLGEGPLVNSRACLLSSVASQLASGIPCLPNIGITGGQHTPWALMQILEIQTSVLKFSWKMHYPLSHPCLATKVLKHLCICCYSYKNCRIFNCTICLLSLSIDGLISHPSEISHPSLCLLLGCVMNCEEKINSPGCPLFRHQHVISRSMPVQTPATCCPSEERFEMHDTNSNHQKPNQ